MKHSSFFLIVFSEDYFRLAVITCVLPRFTITFALLGRGATVVPRSLMAEYTADFTLLSFEACSPPVIVNVWALTFTKAPAFLVKAVPRAVFTAVSASKASFFSCVVAPLPNVVFSKVHEYEKTRGPSSSSSSLPHELITIGRQNSNIAISALILNFIVFICSCLLINE